MWGQCLLISPVLTPGAKSLRMYLPDVEWWHFKGTESHLEQVRKDYFDEHEIIEDIPLHPTETHQYVRGSPKVNVWCGLLHDRVVGPFFFTETSITGNIYQDLLEIYIFPQINDLEDVTGNSTVFMQDGATPQFSLSVREALNERFPNSWIGRDGPIPWPA
uniref:Glycosyl hydrolase family 31 C-terminal domain-containing protein n=2 Tax=Araneus ventricosus TaxID=182803 RepID=A0A4Y2FXE7_ARAVE|nr:hypothetical protein AVEN_103930-1 [Araneus ventricosus]GBM44349.1 hypothetical protein AVEN_226366-1 [Araneus ventricosus]GBM44357.1 hypothetical protein AVEN_261972-1 [Araneus ventricosus]